MKRFWLVALLLVAGVGPAVSDDKPETPLNDKEKAFVELMQDAVLVGNFNVNKERPGKEAGNQTPERYGIKSITKVGPDQWVVNSQIKYGTLDVTVPVPVQVHWANDTPILSVTDLSIPLVGDGFTSRVMFFDGQYAGTWRHGKVSGLMFGKLEKAKPVEPPVKVETSKSPVSEAAPKEAQGASDKSKP